MKSSLKPALAFAVGLAPVAVTTAAEADEHMFGYVRTAETMPKGALEFDQFTTMRADKGTGTYRAFDTVSELEWGVSDRFTLGGALLGESIDTRNLRVDAYIPGDKSYEWRPAGFEVEGKYNFIPPALHPVGLSANFALERRFLDPHSGFDKDEYSANADLIAQAYLLDARMIWAGNIGYDATYARRKSVYGLPANFEWPVHPEMEIQLRAGTGLTYRFAPSWFIGAETLYESEMETEVGQERWSLFAGPSLHYGGESWWGTLTFFPQVIGGGQQIAGQTDNLQLVERTEYEVRLKFGVEF